MNTYAPVWFDIKISVSEIWALNEIFQVFNQQDICQTIEKNAFFCHPENMCVMRDNRYESWVLKARTQTPKGKSVRTFTTPSINFDAMETFLSETVLSFQASRLKIKSAKVSISG